ncbi:MAG TPA: hypothetical protein VIK27_05115, partial [Candidatus Aquilonibacter sp.]
ENSYGDAAFLLDVVNAAARTRPQLGAVLSIAPLLDPQRFAQLFSSRGYAVSFTGDARMPFVVRDDARIFVRAWHGPIGPLLSRVQVVIGQAGTANEAAAAAGVPVVAFERERDRKTAWYRMRQHGLLGDALVVLPGDVPSAAVGLGELLDDAPRRVAMGAHGRERMGRPGGARAIAQVLVQGIV